MSNDHQAIIGLIKKVSGNRGFIGSSCDLLNTGLMDSFQILVLIAEIEKKFQISIPEDIEILSHFKNVEAISNFIERTKQGD